MLQSYYVTLSNLQSKYKIGKDVDPMYTQAYDVVLNRVNTLTDGIKYRVVRNRVNLTTEELAIIAMDGASFSSVELRGDLLIITSGGLRRNE